jgi:hypothetical protein
LVRDWDEMAVWWGELQGEEGDLLHRALIDPRAVQGTVDTGDPRPPRLRSEKDRRTRRHGGVLTGDRDAIPLRRSCRLDSGYSPGKVWRGLRGDPYVSHGIRMIASAVYGLLRERNSYSLPPSLTVIPAQAGIHCGRYPHPQPEAIYQITYQPSSKPVRATVAGNHGRVAEQERDRGLEAGG